MARQELYGNDSNVQAGDRLTGIDIQDSSTKNFTIESLGEFLASRGLADPSSLNFQFNFAGTSVPSSGLDGNIYYNSTVPSELTTVTVGSRDTSGRELGPLFSTIVGDVIQLSSIFKSETTSYGFFDVISFVDIINQTTGAVMGHTVTVELHNEGATTDTLSTGVVNLAPVAVSSNPVAEGRSVANLTISRTGDRVTVTVTTADGETFSDEFVDMVGNDGEQGVGIDIDNYTPPVGVQGEDLEVSIPLVDPTGETTPGPITFTIPAGQDGADGDTITITQNAGGVTVTSSGGTSGVVNDGRTILSGSGTPSSSLGSDGDFYIDTTANEIYGPKASGAWPSGVSIIGDAGAPGRSITMIEPSQGSTADDITLTISFNSGDPVVLTDVLHNGEDGNDGVSPDFTTGPHTATPVAPQDSTTPGTPTVTVGGTQADPTLDIGVPTGLTGDTGATPSIGIGSVTTVMPTDSAAVTLDASSTDESPVLDFAIPQGHTGLYEVRVYQALDENDPQPTVFPADGEFQVVIETGVVTEISDTTDWTTDNSHSADQTLWIVSAIINPPLDTADGTTRTLDRADWNGPFTGGSRGNIGAMGLQGFQGDGVELTSVSSDGTPGDTTTLTFTNTDIDGTDGSSTPTEVEVVLQPGNPGVGIDVSAYVEPTPVQDTPLDVSIPLTDGNNIDFTVPSGGDGPQGRRGVGEITVYMSVQDGTTAVAPSNTIYDLDFPFTTNNGLPTGWSESPATAPDGFSIYGTHTRFNPSLHDTDSIPLTWSTPFLLNEGPEGPEGEEGPQGPQGRFNVNVFQSFAEGDTIPATVTFNIDENGDITSDLGDWSLTPTNVDNEDLYEARYNFDPEDGAVTNAVFNVFRAGEAGPAGMDGDDGESAYEAYVNTTTDNPVLSEAAWVASLAAEDGNGIVSILRTAGDGSEGTEDTYTITYTDGNTDTITVQNGSQGQSAYDVYVGTVPMEETPLTLTEWLLSLRGTNGQDGMNGVEGAQGLSRIELYTSDDPQDNPPTGVVLNTADFTFDTITPNWGTTFTSGDYVSFTIVNPALFVDATYDVPENWSIPVLATALGPSGPAGAPGEDGADGIDFNVNALRDDFLPTVGFITPDPADLTSLESRTLPVVESGFVIPDGMVAFQTAGGTIRFPGTAWSEIERIAFGDSDVSGIFRSTNTAGTEFLVYGDADNWAVFLSTANNASNFELVSLVTGEFNGAVPSGQVTIYRENGTRFFSENYGKILVDSNVRTDGTNVTVTGGLFIGTDPVLTDNGVDANVNTSATGLTALTTIEVDGVNYRISGSTPPSGGGTGTGLSLFTDVLTTVPVTADFNTTNMDDRGEAHHSQSVSFNYDEGGPETQYALLAVPTNLLGSLTKPVIHLSGVFQLDPNSIMTPMGGATTTGYSAFYFDLAEDINVQIDL